MSDEVREERVLKTFARLADTLVADYDVVDLLQSLVETCRDLLDTSEAGILLADGGGELEVVASTSESSRLVEIMQLGAEAGPCIESYHTGRVVSVPDISAVPDEWARFRESALEQGFESAHAVPLRLRETVIGTLNLLGTSVGELDALDVVAAQAFADVATIGILHERALHESAILTEQLQTALNRRVIIEQAKGVISHTHEVSMDEAFTLIRTYSRSHQLRLGDVAARIVDRSLSLPATSENPHNP